MGESLPAYVAFKILVSFPLALRRRVQVTRSSSGAIEWTTEVGLLNLCGHAETIRARVAQTKHDFSVVEVKNGVHDAHDAYGGHRL